MYTQKPIMIPLSRAVRMIRDKAKLLGAEDVLIGRAAGRVLGEEIAADTDLPPFDRSQMDGFAVRFSDIAAAPVELKIVGESAAGKGWHHTLNGGEAVRIMTGAPVPKGADSVQIIEKASENNGSVTILEPARKGANIVAAGKEIRKGMRVLKKGALLTPRSISVPAAFGYAKVRVARLPKVAIVSTGSEIVPVSKKPGRDQIRNSNSLMLRALCENDGCIAMPLPIVRDDLDKLTNSISKALKKADILITTGGVSVGKYDVTKAALKTLGADIHFERVCIKPGKPVVFATLGDKLIFGLPGNPVSAAVTYYLLVRSAIRLLQGAEKIGLTTSYAIAANDLKAAAERDTYLPASLVADQHGKLFCRALKWSGSSDFIGFSGAEALIFMPKGTTASEGNVVKILILDR